MKRGRFTLVELLVVIGILSLLAALLLPSLQRASDEARKVACLSGERQIGLMMEMYLGDHVGRYPPPNMQYMTPETFASGKEKTLPHFLGVYMDMPHWYAEKYGSSQAVREFRVSVLYCPSNSLPRNQLTLFRGGYGMSPRLPKHLAYSTSGSWPTFASTCAHANKLKKPGATVVLGERYRDWHIGKFPPTAADLGNQSANVDLTRHLSGASFLFADGHVGYMTDVEITARFDKGYRLTD